jgi:peptidyl-prolyl cis-trans isomerase D
MPIMTRMRDSMPVILFGLLIAFLITIIFEWGMDYLGLRSGHSDVVGTINGKKVTYKEFTELVKMYADNQKARTGTDPDENQMRQVREQVWQNLVTQALVDEEINRLGIKVTNEELLSWVRSDSPPEELKRYFIDSTGTFRRDIYERVLEDPNQVIQDPQGIDPAYGTKWLAAQEKNLRQQRAMQKLQSLVLASVRVGEGEILARFNDINQQYDVQYAFFDPNAMVTDDEVVLTDSDLKQYYDENIDQYKFEGSRTLKYVVFNEAPSSDDSANVMREIEDVAAKAIGGMDFLELVYTYSEKPDSGAFFKRGELPATLDSAVFQATIGSIVGPMLEPDGYHLAKILAERKGSAEVVRASHILFSFEGQDSNEVKATAQKVLRMAREGKDFAQLAMEYSKDPSNAKMGGDLGWFGKGRMVKEFENAAFGARVGEVVGPVRSPFGIHIIKLFGKDNRERKVAQVRTTISTSQRTKDQLFDRARDFAYNARESEFAKEAEATGLELKETQLQGKGAVIPGIGVNESISRWARDEKVGKISEPYTIPSGYAVFMVAQVKNPGFLPFDDVKESLRQNALRKKKIEKLKTMAVEFRGTLSPGDSLSRIATMHPGIKVARSGNFAPGSSVPGIGRDMAFIGATTGLQDHQIGGPVEGLRGVYLIQLLSKSAFDSTVYNHEKESLRSQLLSEKKNRFLTDWLNQLKEVASIEDNRERLFR